MASHLYDFLCPWERRHLIDCAFKKMKRVEDSFDIIAVRGVSGVLLGSILADRLEKRIAVVRKPKDDTHSHEKIECRALQSDKKRFVIVDDFISSGNTVDTIIDAMCGSLQAVCVGIFCVSNQLRYNAVKYHRNIPIIHCNE